MNPELTRPGRFTPIRQLSVYAENKVGRLNELTGILAANKVHVLALSSVDATDSSMIRIVVDYPEAACALLEENNFPYSVAEVVCVEFDSEANLKFVTCALVEAEINIHYIYPFLMRPHGKSGLVIRLEDSDVAMEVLRQHQIKVLSQDDITR